MSIKAMILLTGAVLTALILGALIFFPDVECDVFVDLHGTVTVGACYEPEQP